MIAKTLIRLKMKTMSRRAAGELALRELERTLGVVAANDAGCARRVGRMPGVDPEMRGWSLLQIVEHNVIVNRQLTRLVVALANGDEIVSSFDIKKDVLPSESPDQAQVGAFRRSVADHLESVAPLGELRGTRRFRHPIFGLLDAHEVHCLFGLHLMIHRRQAEAAVKPG